MAERAVIRLDVEAGEARATLESTEASLEDVGVEAQSAGNRLENLGATAQRSGTEFKSAGTQVEQFSGQMDTMRSSASAGANNLGFELVQATQDAKFGMAGLANQIPLITTQFSQLQQKTGSTSGALSALASTFAGPTGVIAAVTLLLTFKDDILSFFDDTAESAKQADKEFSGFKTTVDDLTTALQNAQETFQEVDQFSFDLRAGRPEDTDQPVPGPVPGQEVPEEEIERFRDLLTESSDAARLLEAQLRGLEGFDLATVLTGDLSAAREVLSEFQAEINQILTEPTDAIVRRPQVFANQVESQLERIQDRQQRLVDQGLQEQEDAVQRQVDFLESALTQASDALTSDQFQAFFSGLQSQLTDLGGQLEDNTEETEKQLTALEKQEQKQQDLKEALEEIAGGEQDALIEAKSRTEELERQVELARNVRDMLLGIGEGPQAQQAPTLSPEDGAQDVSEPQTDSFGRITGPGSQLAGSPRELGQTTQDQPVQGQPQGFEAMSMSLDEIQGKFGVTEEKAKQFKQTAKNQMGQIIGAVGNLGSALATVFSDGEKSAKDFASAALSAIGGVISAIPGVGQIAGPAFGAAGQLVGSFQHGGEVDTPLQIVGEEGPELAALPQGSQVAPNSEAKTIIQNLSESQGQMAGTEGPTSKDAGATVEVAPPRLTAAPPTAAPQRDRVVSNADARRMIQEDGGRQGADMEPVVRKLDKVAERVENLDVQINGFEAGNELDDVTRKRSAAGNEEYSRV